MAAALRLSLQIKRTADDTLARLIVFAANLLTRLGGTTNYSHYVAECGLLLSPFGHPGHDTRAILTGASWG